MGQFTEFSVGLAVFLLGLIGEGFFSWVVGDHEVVFFGVGIVGRILQYIVMAIGMYLVLDSLGLRRTITTKKKKGAKHARR